MLLLGLLWICSLPLFAQRQLHIIEAESFVKMKKADIVDVLSNKQYEFSHSEAETYTYEKFSKTGTFRIILSFKRSDLLYVFWIEESKYCKEVTSEMMDGDYFLNEDISTTKNTNNLSISLAVKPSEDRLYLMLKQR